jgi:group I intron endonuclease
MNFKQKKNLFAVNLFDMAFSEPGLYQIRCLKNDNIYIGESECCLDRLGGHLKDLRNRRHHCLSLQKDFLLYGTSFFEANIIDSGSQWQSLKARKKEEKRLIKLIDGKKLYNFDKTLKEKPCFKSFQYDGQKFPTIKALREYYNEKGLKNQTLVRPLSETTFRRNFISPYGKNYGEITFVKVTKQLQQYCVKGEICYGVEEIVEKGFAKNKRQAVYRVSSSKWPDYQYIKKLQVTKNRRKISINGVIYTTEEIIEKGLAENREVIYARLRSQSSSWKNWFWVDKPKKS